MSISSDLKAAAGDVQVFYADGTYALDGDYQANAIGVVRPVTTGPLKGFRALSATNELGALLDLSGPHGLEFLNSLGARLIVGGFYIKNGHINYFQPDLTFWRCHIEEDADQWALAQGGYISITVTATSGSKVLTQTAGPSVAGRSGQYVQCHPIGYGSNTPGVHAPTISSIAGATITTGQNATSSGSFTALVGDDPAQGYYSRPRPLWLDHANAKRLSFYGCEIGPGGSNIFPALSTDVLLEGCLIHGDAEPAFDPTSVIHNNAISGDIGGGQITNFTLRHCKAVGRILIADATNPGDVVPKAVNGVVFDDVWHDHNGLAGLQFMTHAAKTSAARGVFGQLGGSNGPYISYNSATHRIDFYANDNGTIIEDHDPPYNIDPAFTVSRIQMLETSVQRLNSGSPAGTSPDVKWKNAHSYGSMLTFLGLAPPAAKRWGDSIGSVAMPYWFNGASGSAALNRQHDMVTRYVTTDKVMSHGWPRIGFSGQDSPGAVVAKVATFYSVGLRNMTLLFDTRNGNGSGWGPLVNDGDFDDGTNATVIESRSQAIAAAVLSNFPDLVATIEMGNEVPDAFDRNGLRHVGKYANLYYWMATGWLNAWADALVAPGSTVNNLRTQLFGQPGSDVYNSPAGTLRSWSQADWCRDATMNIGGVQTVGTSLPARRLGIDIPVRRWVVHPYCVWSGPNVGPSWAPCPVGQVNQFLPASGWREIPFVKAALTEAGLDVPIDATEFGFITAPSWPSTGSVSVPAGTYMFPDQGAPSADGKTWVRPQLYVSNAATSTKPGTSGAWSAATGNTVGYNFGNPAGTVMTENEAGFHTKNAVRQWFGLDLTVDHGVNIGFGKNRTGVLSFFLPADMDLAADFRYGVKPGIFSPYTGATVYPADKGGPPASGPYQQLKVLAANTDTRGPITVPSAPSILLVSDGDASAGVIYAAPTSDGGTPITQYRVRATDQSATPNTVTNYVLPASALGATIGDANHPPALINTHTYSLTVSAHNAAGQSAESAPFLVHPHVGTPPDAPTSLAATAKTQAADLTWVAPAQTGNSPIDKYRVTANPGALTFFTPNGATLRLTATGLTGGTTYTFSVAAHNGSPTNGGYSPESATATATPTSPVGSPTVPAAPTGLALLASASGTATLGWLPANDGGSPVIDYELDVTPTVAGAPFTGIAALSEVVVGLTNGVAYTFSVKARNGVGLSSASASLVVTTAAAADGALPWSSDAAPWSSVAYDWNGFPVIVPPQPLPPPSPGEYTDVVLFDTDTDVVLQLD